MQRPISHGWPISLGLLLLVAPTGQSLLAAESPPIPATLASCSLAEVTLRKITAEADDYTNLLFLDASRRRELGPAWDQSARGKRLKATLARFRSEAASAAVQRFEAEEFRGKDYFGLKRVCYVSQGERIFLGIVPSVAEDPETRDDAAAVIARFIISGIDKDGLLLPAALPPLERASLAYAVAAADRQDYSVALKELRELGSLESHLVPAIYLTQGIVEGKMPGHELRAIAWFGAYLSCFPYTRAPNSAEVRTQINLLYARNEENIIQWLAKMREAAVCDTVEGQRIFLTEVVTDAVYGGELPAARAAAALIPAGTDDQDYARGKIITLLVQAGNLREAQATMEAIRSPYFRAEAQALLADAQVRGGDASAAKRNLAGVSAYAAKTDKATRLGFLERIATIQLLLNDAKAADKTFRALRSCVDERKDPWTDALEYIAAAQLGAGDRAGAVATMQEVPEDKKPSCRDSALLMAIRHDVEFGRYSAASENYAQMQTAAQREIATRDFPMLSSPDGTKPASWIQVLTADTLPNPCALATDLFNDPVKHLASQSEFFANSTVFGRSDLWYEMRAIAKAQINARDVVVRMLGTLVAE